MPDPHDPTAAPDVTQLPTDPTLDPPPPGTVIQTASAQMASFTPAPGPARVAAPPGYELLGELGRGGMGVVFKARQVALDRVVALKMILSGGLAGDAERARFEAEARAVAAFQHPNIVQVFETGEADGHPYLALEFCPGGALDRLTRSGAVEPRRAAGLLAKIARGVAAAHRRGIVHRDLKPANVLLAEDGTPKVTDFGLAKRLDTAGGLSVSGAVMGTPAYMAPEQASGKGKEVGPHSDTYSLGAILYELLTGRPPFRADTVFDTLQLVVTAEPVAPRRIAPGLPTDLETVVLKCLEKDARKRYATADALADDLDRFLAGEPVSARRVGRGERALRWVRRNATTTGLSAVAAGLLVTLVVITLRPRPPAPEPIPPGPTEATADDVLAMAAELDRTDPGWRIEEMDSARRVVAAGENSAPLIDEAAAARPADFEARVERFRKANDALPPPVPLPGEFRVRQEPEWPAFEKALATARRVADRPYGRFPINWSRDAVRTQLPHAVRTREVAALLQWDAVSAASAGDRDAALADCRACVNAGRSLHDEPTVVSQVVRIVGGEVGLHTAERVLALGMASNKELTALADVLRREEEAPIFTTMARAERGGMHWFFLAATAGDLKLSPRASPEVVEQFKQVPKGAAARGPHIWSVRHLTRLVEISRLPTHEQAGPLKEWEETAHRDTPPGARVMNPWEIAKWAAPSRRYRTNVRSAIAGIACERYRMATDEWPRTLADLVPEYLPTVPLDPEDGQPLRFKRLADGLVIYGIGPDGKDDGGSIEQPAPDQPPADFGFRLWDADRRGRPPGS